MTDLSRLIGSRLLVAGSFHCVKCSMITTHIVLAEHIPAASFSNMQEGFSGLDVKKLRRFFFDVDMRCSFEAQFTMYLTISG